MTKMARGALYKIGKFKFDISLLKGITSIVPNNKTFIDIGARGGIYVSELRKLGYLCGGIDGIPDIENKTKGLVEWCDLSEEISPIYECNWDWGLFFEVGEHVPKEYESQVFDNVSMIASEGLIISWASINQRGKNHVNCHSQVYVASEFAKRGWFVDEYLTTKIRNVFDDQHVKQKIMVLKHD